MTAADVYGPSAVPTTQQSGKAPGTPAAPTTTGSLSTPVAAPAIPNPTTFLPQLQGVNPLLAIPFILGCLVLLKLIREWGHRSGEFQTLKLDAYFVLAAGVSGLLVIPFFKAVLQKYRVPAVSAYVANA